MGAQVQARFFLILQISVDCKAMMQPSSAQLMSMSALPVVQHYHLLNTLIPGGSIEQSAVPSSEKMQTSGKDSVCDSETTDDKSDQDVMCDSSTAPTPDDKSDQDVMCDSSAAPTPPDEELMTRVAGYDLNDENVWRRLGLLVG